MGTPCRPTTDTQGNAPRPAREENNDPGSFFLKSPTNPNTPYSLSLTPASHHRDANANVARYAHVVVVRPNCMVGRAAEMRSQKYG